MNLITCYIHPRSLPFLRAVAGSLRSLLPCSFLLWRNPCPCNPWIWRCLELRNLGIVLDKLLYLADGNNAPRPACPCIQIKNPTYRFYTQTMNIRDYLEYDKD